jgi:trehalose-phosphatase
MKKLTEQVIARIAAEPSLFLFLDYDGTLTPIASGPSKAKLSAETRQLLREVKALESVRVAIVSGRSLENLKKYVRIPGLVYAGNHGFEVQGQGISYVHPVALALEHSFSGMVARLKKELAPFRGIFIEPKTFTISVHYRHVRSQEQVRKAKQVLLKSLMSLRHTPVVLADGKKVWEIRPTDQWHKGEAVLWLMRRFDRSKKRSVFPVYVGDDTTDEDAFRAVRKKGIGIRVFRSGKGGSHARYYVHSPAGVMVFLRALIKFRRKDNFSHGK